jgi:hypothetical protein
MVAATHESAAGTGGKIDYAQLAMFGAAQAETSDGADR